MRKKRKLLRSCCPLPRVRLLSRGGSVYVSNAEDGDIGMYTLQAEGDPCLPDSASRRQSS